jgi:hypothetical protein
MKLEDRLTDVLSRIRFNLLSALSGNGRQALGTASKACSTCHKHDACDKWIATHPEGGEVDPPSFCPNAKFIRQYQSKTN